MECYHDLPLFQPKTATLHDTGGSSVRTTSRAALRANAARRPKQAALVLRALTEAGPSGLTREQLGDRLGLAASSVCPRCVELLRRGRIVDSGRTRPTRSGVLAAVLVAAEHNQTGGA